MKGKSGCKQYELAITNYVLGEAIKITKEELFDHLRKCPNCQKDMKDWRATCSVLRAQEYDSRPEVKARSEAFIKKLASQPLPGKTKPIQGKKPINVDAEIGSVARRVWHHLAQNGWVGVDELSRTLKRKAKLHPDDTKLAVGWLAYEKKVYLNKTRQTTYVYLTPPEREIYQSQARV